jgi:hypothetical protein
VAPSRAYVTFVLLLFSRAVGNCERLMVSSIRLLIPLFPSFYLYFFKLFFFSLRYVSACFIDHRRYSPTSRAQPETYHFAPPSSDGGIHFIGRRTTWDVFFIRPNWELAMTTFGFPLLFFFF